MARAKIPCRAKRGPGPTAPTSTGVAHRGIGLSPRFGSSLGRVFARQAGSGAASVVAFLRIDSLAWLLSQRRELEVSAFLLIPSTSHACSLTAAALPEGRQVLDGPERQRWPDL